MIFKLDNAYPNINIDQNTFANTEDNILKDKNNSYILGSIKGKNYYYLNCAPKSLKQANIVFYASEKEAESKGKVLSKSCK